MAKKRMFSLDIVDTDPFLEMPISSQLLYFHLGSRADDDGFVASPKKIARACGANADDMRVLVSKNYIIPFESGVIVITDWKINNNIRPDRYKETIYMKEKRMLQLVDGRYQLSNVGIPDGSHLVYQRDTQSSLGKSSLGKSSIGQSSQSGEIPTLEDVRNYIDEEGLAVNPERFYKKYSNDGWMIDGELIRDWRAIVYCWHKKREEKAQQDTPQRQEPKFNRDHGFDQRDYDYDELEKKLLDY